MKLYAISYFWRCVEPEIYIFTDEKEADAKLKEIVSRSDYSDPAEEGEDCISYQEIDVNIPQLVAEKRFASVEAQKRHNAQETARAVVDFSNNTIADAEEFSRVITTTHRTLQQSVMRLFMACIHKWSSYYDDKYYDARNEATCLLAHNIEQAVMDRDGLPFI